jgi:chromosome segregation ATPase
MRKSDTTEKGEHTMSGAVVETEREQVIRWMEEGRHILEVIASLLNDFDQLKATAEAAREQNERLQREGQQLREEIGRLKAENERSQKERAEIAQWFSSVMSEAASRLLVERPPA